MNRKTTAWVLAILLVCIAAVVWAQNTGVSCLYNGVWYPEGTRIGSLVCVDGKWR